MYELPLFPLNTVLFPGMPLALHIFEERYKLMIGRCVDQRRPFGVVLIKQGQEALGPLAEPHAVGCTALITEVERLSEGRMNVDAIGRERFRILSLDTSLPYLVGRVERYPLEDGEPEALDESAWRLRPWVGRFLEAVSQVEGVELDAAQLPDDPVALAYLAAALLQISPDQKQVLLAADQAAGLLADLRELYRQEVAVVKMMLERGRLLNDEESFSLS